MRVKISVMTAIVLLTLTGAAKGQFITAGVSRVQLHCEPGGKEIEVQFDKSLQTLVDEARLAVEKAADSVGKDLAISNRGKLIAAIQLLGDTNGVASVYLIKIKDNDEVDTSKSPDTTNLVPVLHRYKLRAIEPLNVDDLSDVIRFRVVGLDSTDDTLGFVIQNVTKKPAMAVVTADSACGTPKIDEDLPDQTLAKDLLLPKRRTLEYIDSQATKDDANLFVDITTEGSKRTAADQQNYFTSISASFIPKHFTKMGWGGAYEFQPFFLDVSVNTSEKKKIYTTTMGSRINHLRVFGDDGRGHSNKEDKRQVLPGIATVVTGKFEIDRFFETVNAVGEVRSGLPFNMMQSRAWKLRVEPYLGVTFGAGLKAPDKINPLALATGFNGTKWIRRPFVGGELLFEGFRDRVLKPTLTVTYIRMFPTIAEIYYGKDVAGNKFVAGRSKIVRDYVTGKIAFDFGKFLTPFLSYERGRKPPGYELVNSAFKIGIGLKFKGKDR